jgi:hypothetical protein
MKDYPGLMPKRPEVNDCFFIKSPVFLSDGLIPKEGGIILTR